jgi:hypothetical protein
MSVQRPDNKELSALESFLDNDAQQFDGSDFYETLRLIYEELDQAISELKAELGDLVSEKSDLEQRLEELE